MGDMNDKSKEPVLTTYTARAKLVDDKLELPMTLPGEFQGHTYTINLRRGTTEIDRSGPYRIEYTLCTEFGVYSSDSSAVDLKLGFSNLTVSEEIPAEIAITLLYAFPVGTARREAEMSLRAKDGMLQALILELSEETIENAVTVANQLISDVLDSLTIRRLTPLQIHHIDVYQVSTGEILRSYLTVPYTARVPIDKGDFHLAQAIPELLAPCLRLFREAVSSANPAYRLLCLYRIMEGMQPIRAKINRALRKKGIGIKRMSRVVPDTTTTRQFFQDLIGKPFDKFRQHVYKHYRIPVAHMVLDKYDQILLDPGKAKINQKVDATNGVLVGAIREMILEELELMLEHGLFTPGLRFHFKSLQGDGDTPIQPPRSDPAPPR